MNTYRIKMIFKTSRNMEKYFTAKDDTQAMKYFLMECRRTLKEEGVEFDQVIVAGDTWSMVAYYGDSLYFKATLHCVPNRCRRLESHYLEDVKIETIINKMGEEYKNRFSRRIPKEVNEFLV